MKVHSRGTYLFATIHRPCLKRTLACTESSFRVKETLNLIQEDRYWQQINRVQGTRPRKKGHKSTNVSCVPPYFAFGLTAKLFQYGKHCLYILIPLLFAAVHQTIPSLFTTLLNLANRAKDKLTAVVYRQLGFDPLPDLQLVWKRDTRVSHLCNHAYWDTKFSLILGSWLMGEISQNATWTRTDSSETRCE
jgi:hypothetical protein